ncbi:MAG TPA: serine/threonine-protein kinase [Pyrinomonadaceae bacterium]
MVKPGTVLNSQYLVVERVGNGGMGEVYLALHQQLGCPCAIKRTFNDSEIAVRSFRREASLLANLKHQALPKVTNYFSEHGAHYLVMEYMEGKTLEDELESLVEGDELLPTDLVLAWADELLEVLDYLHSHEPPILHLDIKPSNVMETGEGKLVLLDFGLALGAAGSMNTSLVTETPIGYTRRYAALEQVQPTSGEMPSPQSDLYALAATIYDMLAGGRARPDAVDRSRAVISGKADPIESVGVLRPDLPEPAAAVIMRALELDPRYRPQSAAHMRRELRRAVAETRAEESGEKSEKARAARTARVSSAALLPPQASEVPTPPESAGVGETTAVRAPPPGPASRGDTAMRVVGLLLALGAAACLTVWYWLSPSLWPVGGGPEKSSPAEATAQARAAFDRGVGLKKIGNYEGAVEALRQAASLNEKDAAALYELGAALLLLRRYEEAVGELNRSLEIRPNYPDTLRGLGAAYEALGRWPEAAAVYGRAVKLEPADSRTHFNLGKALKAAGDKGQAVKAFRDALRNRKNFPAAHYELGLLYLETGNEKGAIAKYLTLTTVDPPLADQLYGHFSIGQKAKILSMSVSEKAKQMLEQLY